MNKAVLIIAVVIVGLVAGGWLLFGGGGKGAKEVPAPSGGGEEAAAPEEKGFTGKLKDALSLGKSMNCTWRENEENFGTSYIKGEKVYTDVTYAGKRMYSIMAENCVYTWEEGKTDGFKMCFEPEEIAPEEVEKEEGGIPSAEEFFQGQPDIDYNCVTAIVSDSMFNPPSNVKFVSAEEMMQQFMPTQ